jgi:hypothetical protein
MRKYRTPVSTIPADRDTGKEMPFLSIQGMTKNIGSEGNTYQKVPSAWEAIFSTVSIFSSFLVSPYIQIMTNTDINGREAIKLPNSGSFFETSETRTIMAAVKTSFIKYQISIST